MEKLLEFENVGYFYKTNAGKNYILDNVNFSFEKGKLYTIVGPSGSGKTTALSLASALEPPKSGKIYFKGEELEKIGLTEYRSRKIGIVFQSYNLINYMNALQNVVMAMEISGLEEKDKKKRATELLASVGIDKDKIKRNINKLSGGEQQRVAIARALSSDPEIILADEPTGNLDSATAVEIMDVFLNLAHNMGKCVIAVTHSQNFAEKADVIINLENRNFVLAPPKEEEAATEN